MAPYERRVSVRKRKASKHGKHAVRLRIGRPRWEFVASEERLCAYSPYFRNKLQQKRRKVEGVCPICHEDLNSSPKDITFCRSSCRANFHQDCIKEWHTKSTSATNQPNCPLCRQDWTKPSRFPLHRFPELNEAVFDMYDEWIHHSLIPVRDEGGMEHPDFVELVSAYLLGIKLQDRDFQQATLEACLELCKDTGQYPNPACIKKLYNMTADDHSLRQPFVKVFLTVAQPSWLGDEDTDYPVDFVRDLAAALIKEKPDSNDWDLVAAKRKLCSEGRGNDCENDAYPSQLTIADSDPHTMDI